MSDEKPPEATPPGPIPEPSNPIELDEQLEATIISRYEQAKNHDVRTSIFKTMVDFKNALMAKGLTHDEVCEFIGNISFNVHPDIYGTAIYHAALEVSVDNTFRIRQAFLEDFNNDVFISMSHHLNFIIR